MVEIHRVEAFEIHVCHCGRTGWEAEECRDLHCPRQALVRTTLLPEASENPDLGVISISQLGSNGRQVGGAHYSSDGIQHWDFVMMHGLNYLEGNATKYLSRWRKKNGVQDLEKSEHYVSKLLELAHEGMVFPRSTATLGEINDFCQQYGLSTVLEFAAFATLSSKWTIMDLVNARTSIQLLITQARDGLT